MFFVYGHLVNERCDAHACLAGVSTARGVLGLVLSREMLTNLSKTWYEKHCNLTLRQFARCTVGLGFVLGCMFRILQVAFGCLGSCV